MELELLMIFTNICLVLNNIIMKKMFYLFKSGYEKLINFSKLLKKEPWEPFDFGEPWGILTKSI